MTESSINMKPAPGLISVSVERPRVFHEPLLTVASHQKGGTLNGTRDLCVWCIILSLRQGGAAAQWSPLWDGDRLTLTSEPDSDDVFNTFSEFEGIYMTGLLDPMTAATGWMPSLLDTGVFLLLPIAATMFLVQDLFALSMSFCVRVQ